MGRTILILHPTAVVVVDTTIPNSVIQEAIMDTIPTILINSSISWKITGLEQIVGARTAPVEVVERPASDRIVQEDVEVDPIGDATTPGTREGSQRIIISTPAKSLLHSTTNLPTLARNKLPKLLLSFLSPQAVKATVTTRHHRRPKNKCPLLPFLPKTTAILPSLP